MENKYLVFARETTDYTWVEQDHYYTQKELDGLLKYSVRNVKQNGYIKSTLDLPDHSRIFIRYTKVIEE